MRDDPLLQPPSPPLITFGMEFCEAKLLSSTRSVELTPAKLRKVNDVALGAPPGLLEETADNC
jgi:hypothetical protein